jgi:hypothetical protein
VGEVQESPGWRGRPLNSGTWASGEDFEQAVRVAVEGLRGQGKKVKQEAVAESLGCGDRQLRRWIKRWDLKWEELIRA